MGSVMELFPLRNGENPGNRNGVCTYTLYSAQCKIEDQTKKRVS